MDATKTKPKEKVIPPDSPKPMCLLQTHIEFHPTKIPVPIKKSITPPRPRPTNDFGF